MNKLAKDIEEEIGKVEEIEEYAIVENLMSENRHNRAIYFLKERMKETGREKEYCGKIAEVIAHFILKKVNLPSSQELENLRKGWKKYLRRGGMDDPELELMYGLLQEKIGEIEGLYREIEQRVKKRY